MGKTNTIRIFAAVMLFAGFQAYLPAEDGTFEGNAFASNKIEAREQGLEAFRMKDWASSVVFLRQAVSVPAYSTANTWYMLIMSEMYAGEFSAAVKDCDSFLNNFADDPLCNAVQYQKGRGLHYLSRNDSAVLVLSDFCHANPGDPMYASALYWIAECFYEDCDYATAEPLYERVVNEFPTDAKVPDAKFRLEEIKQYGREEKLMYLLKMTGEEFLSSRENYERQLREYQTQDMVGLRSQLGDAQKRIKELETQSSKSELEARQSSGQSYENESYNSKGVADEDLAALKAKAAFLERVLERKEAESQKRPE
ncbi:MAG: tetratricopeptide repeat protein [Treponema sp.]|nr:tetratricopeptide repeat protein [Treponema sp.]